MRGYTSFLLYLRLGDERGQNVLLRVPYSIPSLTPHSIPSCSAHAQDNVTIRVNAQMDPGFEVVSS
jgi:hypothetical protein